MKHLKLFLAAMVTAFMFTTEAWAEEAYACLSNNDATLTFYYDNLRNSRTGTKYDLNTSGYPGWYSKRMDITKVVFDSSFANARPTTCINWFNEMTQITSVTGIQYLKTDNVTNMSYMFAHCNELESLDVSGFNTANVTNMSQMFSYCRELTSLDVSGFNTANVTNMSKMFCFCSSLTSLNLSKFTFNTTLSSDNMLQYCLRLGKLAISATASNLAANACSGVGTGLDTEDAPCVLIYPEGFTPDATPVGNGKYQWKGGNFKDAEPEAYALISTDNKTLTFYYDNLRIFRSETTFDLNTFGFMPMWHDMSSSIENVVFDTSFANARPTYCGSWFQDMSNLTSITGIKNLKTDEVTHMKYMFHNCSRLKSLNLSTFDTENVTDMYQMFYGCSNLTDLNVSGFNTQNVTTLYGMFTNCSSLKTLDLSSFYIPSQNGAGSLLQGCSGLKRLSVGTTANNIFQSDAFLGVGTTSKPCQLLYPESITLDNVEQGDGYFTWYGGYFKEYEPEPYAVLSTDCKTLTFYYDKNIFLHSGIVYDLKTGSYTPEWYDNSSSIRSVVFTPSFARARPTSCYGWFGGMNNLSTITGIEYLKTDEVTDMGKMFRSCSSLSSLDVSGFNTAKVTSMSSMFQGCSRLTSLDVSGFNTAKVIDMNEMFYGCSNLRNVDLSHFDTSIVSHMSAMFYGCSRLTNLDLRSFTFKASNQNSTKLLYNCYGLKMLAIPATANYLYSSACSGVGTTANPCALIVPEGFSTPSGDTFTWKSGTFKKCVPEAYAVLSTDNKTLTFYYDGQKSSRQGTKYDDDVLNTGTTSPEWYAKRGGIENVVFDPSFVFARPTSCVSWFAGMSNITSITGIGNLKTDEVRYMTAMFKGCSSLTSLDLSEFNTANVTSMNVMFDGCTNLEILDLSGFNTAKVTSMSGMFNGCSSLTNLDLRSFTFKAPNQNTSKLLYNCNGLNMLAIPASANYLSSNACYHVGTIENPCTLVYPVGLQDVTQYDGYFTWKSGCFKEGVLESYAVLSTDNKILTFYYDYYRNSRIGNVYGICTGDYTPGWYDNRSSIESVVFDPSFADARPLNCYNWFLGMVRLSTIMGIEYLNTSEVTNMSFMFRDCSSLTSLDLGLFNTSNVTMMTDMFSGCQNLKSLDLRHFDTSNVTDMSCMFYNCSNLEDLDLSHFDTSNVTDMSYMFSGCSNLTSLGVRHFNTSNVTNMRFMFSDCSSLLSLGLTNFDTSNVTLMYSMFFNCSSLKVLDLSEFDTSKVIGMSNMFEDCNNLTTIYSNSNWQKDGLESLDMFSNCERLSGAVVYDGTKIDASMANPTDGYFTAKRVLKGDVNNDNIVDIDDAEALAYYLVGQTPASFIYGAADANNDQKVSIADVTAIIDAVINSNIPVTRITLNESSIMLMTGSTSQLTATVAPSNATNQAVIWESDDPSIATVDQNGLVRAVYTGNVHVSCTITARAADGSGVEAQCTVQVMATGNPNIPVTSITLNESYLMLMTGGTSQLTATVAPSNATNQAVIWESDAPSIATVDQNGLVRAVYTGNVNVSCIITARAADGSRVEAQCIVQVMATGSPY